MQGIKEMIERESSLPVADRSELSLLASLLKPYGADYLGRTEKLLARMNGDISKLLDMRFEEVSDIVSREESEVLQVASALLSKCYRHIEQRLEYGPELMQAIANEMSASPVEMSKILFLDNRFRLLGEEIASKGDSNGTQMNVELVFSLALKMRAGYVVVVHNHPLGNPLPSKEDIEKVVELLSASTNVGVGIRDVLVVGGGNYFSFVEDGLMMQLGPFIQRDGWDEYKRLQDFSIRYLHERHGEPIPRGYEFLEE